MLRWRRSTQPIIPATVEELGETLASGRWGRYAECTDGTFYSVTITRDGASAIILGNSQFIGNFVNSQYTFIDGTFKVVPRQPPVHQILTIFATSMDHAFPVVHVLMERRTRALYDGVFQHIKEHFPSFINATIVIDFEVALTQSLRTAFHNTHLQGCFFHFCQAVYRKAKRIGLIQDIEGDNEAKKILRNYFSLALFPTEHIQPALQLLGENAEFRDRFAVLHHYVIRQWIERVTPENFTVFGSAHRTNNIMESYHRRLNGKLVRHPGVWDLIKTIIDVQNIARLELLTRGGRVFRVARKNVIFDKRLNAAWDKLTGGTYTIQDFFRVASHLTEGLNREFDGRVHHDEDDDLDLPHPTISPSSAYSCCTSKYSSCRNSFK